MSLNLITRTEYKTYAGIKSTNYDSEIDALIPRVSEFVKNYCKRTFVDFMDTAKSEVFDGGFNKLILSETPVVNIVTVESSSNYGQTYSELIKFIDWIQQKDTIVSLSSQGFIEQLNGYKITYFAGYDDVPQDLGLAAMDLLTYYRKNDGAVHNNKTPGGGGSVQLEYIMNTNLPAHIKRVLDLYVADYA